MEVDYRSTDDQFLTQLGLRFFRESQSLYLLSFSGLASRGLDSNMATWIPSFEIVNAPILGPSYSNLRPFDASAGREPIFTVDETLLKLLAKTSSPHLGTIEELGEPWTDMTQGNFNSIMKMLLHCGNTYAPTQQPIVEAF
ncbi:hypothetical protein FZEAL_8415 [Fusarium zealandicum]|uniref:Uncharacterized protein n=1 Tax=Fusarium zealandicum TaxID=1053134 RepID=A0A8H4UEV3_9HYPO|nr:hypothetical protein FZEAL_8415 [Fusarium zealandicum]